MFYWVKTTMLYFTLLLLDVDYVKKLMWPYWAEMNICGSCVDAEFIVGGCSEVHKYFVMHLLSCFTLL